MQPKLIIVGADKGGVGKTTVTTALMDYLTANTKGEIMRAFDTEPAPGVLARRWPSKTALVDITSSDGMMQVFDTMDAAPITIIDARAGILSSMLQTLDDLGYLDKAKDGDMKIAVLHVLGGNVASFSEIKATAAKLTHAQHFLVQNMMHGQKLFAWSDDMRALLAGGMITIPQLDPKSAERADARGGSFDEFCGDKAQSEVMRRYVGFWLKRVYAAFDAAGLNSV